jgi:hypothetical protein
MLLSSAMAATTLGPSSACMIGEGRAVAVVCSERLRREGLL